MRRGFCKGSEEDAYIELVRVFWDERYQPGLDTCQQHRHFVKRETHLIWKCPSFFNLVATMKVRSLWSISGIGMMANERVAEV